MEETAHQKFPVEDDLVNDLVLQHGNLAPPQDQLSQQRRAVIKLFVGFFHSIFYPQFRARRRASRLLA